jgi:hypothetical protein
MGVTPQQVQVAWLKQANAHPPDDFPLHAQQLRDDLIADVQIAHDFFPNLKICYCSSRIYGGYAPPNSLNPEPQAYESGFAVKWMIEQQIAGEAALNFDPSRGPVEAPLLLWGPYLWADGLTPRSDGLTWQESDFEADHTHPGPAAEQKVADMLSQFFANEPTAKPWWAAQGGVELMAVDASADAYVQASMPDSNFGGAADLRAAGGAQQASSYLRFDLAAVDRPVLFAKLSLRIISSGGGPVSLSQGAGWNESTITFANAPPVGPQVALGGDQSRDGSFGAAVTAAVNSDADGTIGLVLNGLPQMAQPRTYASRESSQAPRLILVVPAAECSGDLHPASGGDGVVGPGDLAAVLAGWGACPAKGSCAGDLAPVAAPDGVVGPADLAELLSQWGPCR